MYFYCEISSIYVDLIMENSVNGISAKDLELNSVPVGTYTIARAPQPIGYWILGSGGYATTNFAMYVKPTADQIFNTEQLLGWKWKDA